MTANPLLFFIKKLSRYRWQLLAGLILSLILAISSISLLSLSAWFISASAFAGLSAATAAVFNYFIPAATIRFLALTRILSRYADRVINHDITFKILASLRAWFYQQLIPLAPAYLLSHRSGDLLNNIVNDIDTLDHLYLNVLSPFCIAFLLTLLVTVFILHFSVTLAIVSLVMILITLLIIPIITLQIGNRIGRKIQNAMSAARVSIVDFVQGQVDLLLFVKKENRTRTFDHHCTALINAQRKYALLNGLVIATMQLLSGVTLFLILFFGINLVRHHILNGAELAMILFLLVASFEQFLSVPIATLALGKTQRAAERLQNITSQKPAVIFTSSSIINESKNDIHFNSVSFTYPNRTQEIISDFNYTIQSGTHIGIRGASGSGKTTLMNLLTRIWDPTKGGIFVGEQPLKHFSEMELRKNICFITQQAHIFNASVRDNLTLMHSDISDDACLAALQKVEMLETILSLPDQLNTEMGEFGKNFSGGQIRRITFARALLTSANIFIFDEPSTGLEKELMQRIWENCTTDFKNKTLFVITHDESVLNWMDKIICLKQ